MYHLSLPSREASEQYQRVCYELSKAEIEYFEAMEDRLENRLDVDTKTE